MPEPQQLGRERETIRPAAADDPLAFWEGTLFFEVRLVVYREFLNFVCIVPEKPFAA
jgi:hypothetical protein